MRAQLEIVIGNLKKLGAKRLAGLGAILILLMAGIGIAAKYLNLPTFETLYIGLERNDVSRVGSALSEAGLLFDVDSSGTTILVEAGKTGRARMILAEKGLPASSGAGYELFDNLGSLGLTSFMQEVTRVRALEGEIARSIEAVEGVKAARVHIVMPDRTAFRDRARKPTASILIKADRDQISGKAFAIRHLVAAAVPGLVSEDVTIMDSTGNLLASGQDQFSNSMAGALEMQRNIESDIEQKVSSALGPQLGIMNYRISVQAQIDTDRRATQETVFDPASKVERSVQVVKAEDSSTQQTESQNISVEQNLPKPQQNPASGPKSAEKSQKREETTNFEISSKRIDTERNGFKIEKLAVSIVISSQKIREILGRKATAADMTARLAEIRKVVTAAAGIDADRGDKLNISALEFIDDQIVPITPAGFLNSAAPYVGTVINSAVFLGVALLILLLGIRPMIKAVSQTVAVNPQIEFMPSVEPGQAGAAGAVKAVDGQIEQAGAARLRKDNISRNHPDPAERLRALVDFDSDRTVKVLQNWLAEDAA